MKVFGLVFLFIIRLCFRGSQSIADVISKRYPDKALRLRQLMFEHDSIKKELQCQMSPIDFMHVSSLFLVSNDKAIHKNDKIHCRKLQKLIHNIYTKVLLIMFHIILTK